jgi:hypothetical protein
MLQSSIAKDEPNDEVAEDTAFLVKIIDDFTKTQKSPEPNNVNDRVETFF